MADPNPWNQTQPFSYAGSWLNASECWYEINRRTTDDRGVGWLWHVALRRMARALVSEWAWDGTQWTTRPHAPASPAERPKDSYRCLLLGSSEGRMELEICRAGFVGEIVAIDIAENALARARGLVREAGFTNVRHVAADLNDVVFDGAFDFVIAEGVLHHVRNVGRCLQRIAGALARDGLFFANEYEGPVRFQLSDTQVACINAALRPVPRVLRGLPGEPQWSPATDAEHRRASYQPPTVAAMLAFDPSEALTGPDIRRLMPEAFRIVERRGFGGTLLSYLGARFDFERCNRDPRAAAWLRLLIQTERTLIDSGVLVDDFVFYVAARPDA